MLDAQQIQDIIPHRYPFLLVDRILEVDGEKRAVGIKNVTVNEEFLMAISQDTPSCRVCLL